jgi:hypothetical protein
MTARKPFLLRTDPAVLAALNRWAADELRSVNGQIDYILRRALTQAGRFPARASAQTDGSVDHGAPSEQG